MEGAVEDLEMAVEEEAGEEVGEPAEGEVEVTLKAVEAVEEEEDFKAETARELDRVVVAADLHPRGQAAEEEEEGLPPVEAPVEARVEAPVEARVEAPEISLIDACKTVPAEVVVRKMPRSAAPGGLTV
jgi:xanthine/CO dehydrogenase XdhC/CoxF family maturation factor